MLASDFGDIDPSIAFLNGDALVITTLIGADEEPLRGIILVFQAKLLVSPIHVEAHPILVSHVQSHKCRIMISVHYHHGVPMCRLVRNDGSHLGIGHVKPNCSLSETTKRPCISQPLVETDNRERKLQPPPCLQRLTSIQKNTANLQNSLNSPNVQTVGAARKKQAHTRLFEQSVQAVKGLRKVETHYQSRTRAKPSCNRSRLGWNGNDVVMSICPRVLIQL